MKIYVVAHENIVCPKEYRKVEIMEEDVEGYIKRSVAYQDMLETLPDMSSIGPVEEEFYVDYLSKIWLYSQMQEFYKQCYYNLGDFDLIIENQGLKIQPFRRQLNYGRTSHHSNFLRGFKSC